MENASNSLQTFPNLLIRAQFAGQVTNDKPKLWFSNWGFQSPRGFKINLKGLKLIISIEVKQIYAAQNFAQVQNFFFGFDRTCDKRTTELL